MAARRIRIAIGALAILLILVGIWVALRQHASPTAHASMSSQVMHKAGDGRPAKPAATLSKGNKGSSLWVRPSPDVVSRNHRRSGFSWVLRQLGATESQLDRLTGGDASLLAKELKEKALAGDPASINMLGQLATLNCRASRGSLAGFKKRQITEAQASSLSQPDKDWFAATMNDDIAFDQQIDSLCDQIDRNEVLSWVTARANQGDGGSLWILSQGLPMPDMQQRLREASADGFALAQYSLAMFIVGGTEGAPGNSPDKPNLLDLLTQSASAVPASKAELAVCEYFGQCAGIPIDIDAAIGNAREAAQEGSFAAVLTIGPHLPAGQMDPDEVEAWRLIDASVQQKGCAGPFFFVRSMQNITGTLNANTITPQARALAEVYWGDYGSQIMASLGCTS
jgi:hypothetical protein